MKPSKKAVEVANRCKDAYSAKRYRSWPMVAEYLLSFYNENETEAVMRSKITRWAADVNGAGYGRVPAKSISRFKSDCDAFVRSLSRYLRKRIK